MAGANRMLSPMVITVLTNGGWQMLNMGMWMGAARNHPRSGRSDELSDWAIRIFPTFPYEIGSQLEPLRVSQPQVSVVAAFSFLVVTWLQLATLVWVLLKVSWLLFNTDSFQKFLLVNQLVIHQEISGGLSVLLPTWMGIEYEYFHWLCPVIGILDFYNYNWGNQAQSPLIHELLRSVRTQWQWSHEINLKNHPISQSLKYPWHRSVPRICGYPYRELISVAKKTS